MHSSADDVSSANRSELLLLSLDIEKAWSHMNATDAIHGHRPEVVALSTPSKPTAGMASAASTTEAIEL
jgi:hypothetical protein